jgi:hypothetical protein
MTVTELKDRLAELERWGYGDAEVVVPCVGEDDEITVNGADLQRAGAKRWVELYG